MRFSAPVLVLLVAVASSVAVRGVCGQADTPPSEAPTSEAPTSEAPTSEAPTSEAPTSEAPTSEALRSRFEAMSPVEREGLRRKCDRFSRLTPQEQQRLREIHNRLHQNPQCGQLKQIMQRYHDWLKALPGGQRAELLSLPPAERIERIKEILDRQEMERFVRYAASQLQREDYFRVMEWLIGYVTRRENELLPRLPVAVRERIEGESGSQRRWILLYSWYRYRGDDPILPPDEITDLVESLSDTARQALAKERDPNKRSRLVEGWIRAALFSRRSREPMSERRPEVSTEELTRFFNEELTPREQVFFEGMTSDQMRRELERWYVFRKRLRGDNGSHFRRHGEPKGD